MDSQTLFKEALALPETERVLLVEQLLETLDQQLEESDEVTFVAELQRRSAEIDQGQAELVPWSQLKAEKE